MSHHTPYYARAPLGQTPAAPVVPVESTSMVLSSPTMTLYRVAGMAAGAALAYHGYKRNNSVGWALVWALGGGLVWPVALAISFAQGFAKPSSMRRNRRRRR